MQGVVLSPDQLCQLETIVASVSQDNRRGLEERLGQQADIQQASILTLYNLTSKDWVRMQMVIDNLAIFAVNLMGSLRASWEDAEHLRERLEYTDGMVEGLRLQLREIEQENELFKARINEAQTHIESISGERDRMEEFCRSQSCIQLSGQPSPVLSRKCSICQQYSQVEEEKGDHLRESSRLLISKEEEVVSLQSEKAQLQRRYSELMEEHELVKMQVQLAELAVKDALFFKSKSQTSHSQSSCTHEQIYTTQSHHQFMNGQLECFSHSNSPNASLCLKEEEQKDLLHRPASSSLLYDILGDDLPHCVSSPCFINQDNYTPDLLNTPQASDNPFRKRHQEERCFLQQAGAQSQITPWEHRVKGHLKMRPSKKTVALQCNLAKGLPKLSLFEKRQSKAKNDSTKEVLRIPENQHVSARARPLSKSVILPVEKPVASLPAAEANQPGSGSSIASFYSFLSSKIITNRIKK